MKLFLFGVVLLVVALNVAQVNLYFIREWLGEFNVSTMCSIYQAYPQPPTPNGPSQDQVLQHQEKAQHQQEEQLKELSQELKALQKAGQEVAGAAAEAAAAIQSQYTPVPQH